MDNYDDIITELYTLGDTLDLLSKVASAEYAELVGRVSHESMENALYATSCHIKRVSHDLMEFDANKSIIRHYSPAKVVNGD